MRRLPNARRRAHPQAAFIIFGALIQRECSRPEYPHPGTSTGLREPEAEIKDAGCERLTVLYLHGTAQETRELDTIKPRMIIEGTPHGFIPAWDGAGDARTGHDEAANVQGLHELTTARGLIKDAGV